MSRDEYPHRYDVDGRVDRDTLTAYQDVRTYSGVYISELLEDPTVIEIEIGNSRGWASTTLTLDAAVRLAGYLCLLVGDIKNDIEVG